MADPPLVLVVEDEESFATRSRSALTREGFLVETAADGVEALEQFDAVAPDLVLLDVMLPARLGHRRVPPDPHARRTCRSSWSRRKGSEIDTVVGLEVGADDYVDQAVPAARARRPHAGGAAPGAASARTRRSTREDVVEVGDVLARRRRATR